MRTPQSAMHRVKETFARDVPREGAAGGASRGNAADDPRPTRLLCWMRSRPTGVNCQPPARFGSEMLFFRGDDRTAGR